ncbi:MAG: RepB plasmid partition [Burkholderiales bacterium]|nr:RepB plasmid partition [Burkholderiales bacterium]
MLNRAVEKGVTARRLADALDLDISTITHKLNLLDGIFAGPPSLLKDQQFAADLGTILKKMNQCAKWSVLGVGGRQLSPWRLRECTVCSDTGEPTGGCRRRQKVAGVSPTQMANMEREMGSLQEQYKLTEQNFSQDVFNLLLASKFLTKWLENAGSTIPSAALSGDFDGTQIHRGMRGHSDA